MGFVNFCMPWPTQHTLMAHELAHLLGFNDDYFSMSFQQYRTNLLLGRTGGSSIQFARDHFACQSIEGIPSVGGHLDGLFVGDDFMQPCVSFQENHISELFAHLLGEIGWPVLDTSTFWTVHQTFYDVNFSFVDPQLYGYHRGCGFMPDLCPQVIPAGVRCTSLCRDYTDDFAVPTTLQAAEDMAAHPENWVPYVAAPSPSYETSEGTRAQHNHMLGIGLVLLASMVAVAGATLR